MVDLANGIVVTVLYGLITASAFGGWTPDGEPGRAAIGPTVLLVIWGLAVVVPSVAVTVRRLHDAGQSGWFSHVQRVRSGHRDAGVLRAGASPNAVEYGPPYPQGYAPGAYGPGQTGYVPAPSQY